MPLSQLGQSVAVEDLYEDYTMDISNNQDSSVTPVFHASPGTFNEADALAAVGLTSGEVVELDIDNGWSGGEITVNITGTGSSSTKVASGGSRTFNLLGTQSFNISVAGLATGVPSLENRVLVSARFKDPA